MITRRKFLRRSLQALGAGAALAGAAAGYGFWEASSVRVDRRTITIPNLPEPFVGKTVAVLADLHLGPHVSIGFIRKVIRMANALKPDLFALVGDYGHRGGQAHVQLVPCLEALAELSAPLGVFAVPGNHDMRDGGQLYRDTVAGTPITDLTNSSAAVTCEGERLWLAGVDDLWWGRPNVAQALELVPPRSAVVLLCHNPDFMEEQPDSRVGLALCGHTHGGQVYLPVVGAPWTPTKYGDKYRHGLVQGPASQVFVSRGLGESGVPLRIGSPPEINLITLAAAG
jgi:predicted MPP superfamily phosphohydrolase